MIHIMVKRFFTTLSLLGMMLGAQAAAKYMTIEKKDGSMISFALAEKPVITYAGGSLVINEEAKTTYALDDIANYHFTETEATDAKFSSAELLKIVQVDAETIEVQNAKVGSVVRLTAISGVEVLGVKADTDGNVEVKLPSQKGVYVLSVGNQSFKVIRK